MLESQRRWWTALATSDTSYLRAHSTPDLTVTLSSGKTFSVDSLIRTYGTSRHSPQIAWSEERLEYGDAKMAILTTLSTETEGPRSSAYRYLTVLRNQDGAWKVAAAQSTRRNTFAPRAPQGSLNDFAGDYKTPRGLMLKLSAQENALTLREPSGLEVRLEPIGLNLFEANFVSPDGSITRYSFGRNPQGQVVSMSVLAPGMVNTFPKAQ